MRLNRQRQRHQQQDHRQEGRAVAIGEAPPPARAAAAGSLRSPSFSAPRSPTAATGSRLPDKRTSETAPGAIHPVAAMAVHHCAGFVGDSQLQRQSGAAACRHRSQRGRRADPRTAARASARARPRTRAPRSTRVAAHRSRTIARTPDAPTWGEALSGHVNLLRWCVAAREFENRRAEDRVGRGGAVAAVEHDLSRVTDSVLACHVKNRSTCGYAASPVANCAATRSRRPARSSGWLTAVSVVEHRAVERSP